MRMIARNKTASPLEGKCCASNKLNTLSHVNELLSAYPILQRILNLIDSQAHDRNAREGLLAHLESPRTSPSNAH
jgi:hypothetical protein